MGQFLSTILREDYAKVKDTPIDLDNAVPSASAALVCEEIDAFLVGPCKQVKQKLEHYPDHRALIAKNMNASAEAKNEACLSIASDIADVNLFWRHSMALFSHLESLLSAMVDQRASGEQLLFSPHNQALHKRLIGLLEFVLEFDHKKMFRPQIQNAFSFYKRNQDALAQTDAELPVALDDAERVSMFIAEASPLLDAVCKQLATKLDKRPELSQPIIDCANGCCFFVKHSKFSADSQLNWDCLRAMVTAMLVHDRTDKHGVFHSKSSISTKTCVGLLTKTFPKRFGDKFPPVNALVNALLYSSLHFKDATTPQNIAASLQNFS